MERKRSRGFEPFESIINIYLTQPKITYQKQLWKYVETHYFVSFHDPIVFIKIIIQVTQQYRATNSLFTKTTSAASVFARVHGKTGVQVC